MTVNDGRDAHDTRPGARTWEEWRHMEQLPSEPHQEPVQIVPFPPDAFQTPPGTQSTPDGSPERIPEVLRIRIPAQPHELEPGTETRFPTPEGISVPVPTMEVPRTPRPFIESGALERPGKGRLPEQPGQRIRLVHAALPEGRSTTPPLPEARTSEKQRPEEKTADRKKKLPVPEEKASDARNTRKLDHYDGKLGRKHTEKKIEEILDWYLQTGGLPQYVSDRQRYSYRHHRTLPERRQLLEQQGITLVVPETGANQGHVIPLGRTGSNGVRRATGSV